MKRLWRARIDPPAMPADLAMQLHDIFDADLAQLGAWLGVSLDCDNFHEITSSRSLEWAAR
jgi:hypothetical protein